MVKIGNLRAMVVIMVTQVIVCKCDGDDANYAKMIY